MTAAPDHVPVLLAPCLELLQPTAHARFIDCTVNGGGYSQAILERTGPDGPLLAIDADASAIGRARDRLSSYRSRVIFANNNFRSLEGIAGDVGFKDVDGIVMDLGLSSIQLSTADRGFAFSTDGPLDMRFDQSSGRTAEELLAVADAAEIEQVLRAFGEEPRARRIAQAIVAERVLHPIQSTAQLAALVARVAGHGGRIHPATRTFQALRIAVNDELSALSDALPQALNLLRRGARLAVISFHSLEDRIVKTFFVDHSGRTVGSRLPVAPTALAAEIRIITKKPVVATAEEQAQNPRSRSARLRVAERL